MLLNIEKPGEYDKECYNQMFLNIEKSGNKTKNG